MDPRRVILILGGIRWILSTWRESAELYELLMVPCHHQLLGSSARKIIRTRRVARVAEDLPPEPPLMLYG